MGEVRRVGALALWRRRARALKTEVHALYLAYRDPRVPWYGRLVAACVVAYAFSPLDLIPDPIPVLGYLDDLILVPLGIMLALRLIPPQVMEESRAKAHAAARSRKPTNWIAAGSSWRSGSWPPGSPSGFFCGSCNPDVSADDQALDEVVNMGFSATPVTIIDGEAVVGFNKARLEQLLEA